MNLGKGYTGALCTNLRIPLLVLNHFQVKQKFWKKTELNK